MSKLIKSKKHFTIIGNTCIRDNTISHQAKGLLAMLLSMADDWNYSISGLASDNVSIEGRDRIRSEINELERHRYLVRVQFKNKLTGRFTHSDYIVNDEPLTEDYINEVLEKRKKDHEDEIPVIMFADKPMTDYPTADMPTQRNNLNKKYRKKNSSARQWRLWKT